MVRRTYNGTNTVGAPATVTNPDATAWTNARGGFWVGGTLFYGMSGALQRRTFNGTTLGPPSLVDPYHDALWDTIVTDGNGPEGQTYAGVASNFYGEINNVTGMFYAGGRLYYTLTGQGGLFWRWFTPDTGTVGADKFTVSGASGFTNSGGIFVSGTDLHGQPDPGPLCGAAGPAPPRPARSRSRTPRTGADAPSSSPRNRPLRRDTLRGVSGLLTPDFPEVASILGCTGLGQAARVVDGGVEAFVRVDHVAHPDHGQQVQQERRRPGQTGGSHRGRRRRWRRRRRTDRSSRRTSAGRGRRRCAIALFQ